MPRGMVAFKPLEDLRGRFLDYYVTSQRDGDAEHVVLVRSSNKTDVLPVCPLDEREHRTVRQLLRQGATIETLLCTYDRAEPAYRQRIQWLLLASSEAFAAAHEETLLSRQHPHIAFLEMYGTETARQLELRLSVPPLRAAFACYVLDTRKMLHC